MSSSDRKIRTLELEERKLQSLLDERDAELERRDALLKSLNQSVVKKPVTDSRGKAHLRHIVDKQVRAYVVFSSVKSTLKIFISVSFLFRPPALQQFIQARPPLHYRQQLQTPLFP